MEVTCYEEKQWAVSEASIVQVDELKTDKPTKGIHPIAMLRGSKSGELVLFQISFFNLQHRAAVQQVRSATRHFFWPA